MAKKATAKKAAKAAAPAKKKAAKKSAKKEVKTKEAAEEAPEEKPAKEKAGKKSAKKSSTGLGSPEKTYQTMKDLMVLIDDDVDKFLVNETRAAGRRLRAHAQQLRKSCAIFRKEIQALANQRKGK